MRRYASALCRRWFAVCLWNVTITRLAHVDTVQYRTRCLICIRNKLFVLKQYFTLSGVSVSSYRLGIFHSSSRASCQPFMGRLIATFGQLHFRNTQARTNCLALSASFPSALLLLATWLKFGNQTFAHFARVDSLRFVAPHGVNCLFRAQRQCLE